MRATMFGIYFYWEVTVMLVQVLLLTHPLFAAVPDSHPAHTIVTGLADGSNLTKRAGVGEPYADHMANNHSYQVDPKYSPYVVILKRNSVGPNGGNEPDCDPQSFITVLVSLLNLFCTIPRYCYGPPDASPSVYWPKSSIVYPLALNLDPVEASQTQYIPPNITTDDVIWKWYPAGLSKVYLKFMVRLPALPEGDQGSAKGAKDSFVPTSVIQDVLSRMDDVIEARLGCEVINPMKTYYTYAFWVMPLVAGFLFFLILAGVVLLYHAWDPRIEDKIMAKLQYKEEVTKLIHDSTNVPESLADVDLHTPNYFQFNNSTLNEKGDKGNGLISEHKPTANNTQTNLDISHM